MAMDDQKLQTPTISANSALLVKEDEVSGPLKHLLSLDWESSVTTSKSNNMDIDDSKCTKKVRFSDEVKQISFSDDDKKSSDELSDFEENENLPYDVTNISSVPDQNTNAKYSEMGNSESEHLFICKNDINDHMGLTIKDNELPLNLTNIDVETNLVTVRDCDEKSFENKNGLLQGNCINNQDYIISETDELNDFSAQIESLSIESSNQNDSFIEINPSKKIDSFPSDKIVQPPYEYDKLIEGNSTPPTLVQKGGEADSITTLRQRTNKDWLKLYKEKQSSKLNLILKKNLEFSKASDLKLAVFEAWHNVKNATEGNLTTISAKKDEHSKKKSSKHGNMLRQKSKAKVLKNGKIDGHTSCKKTKAKKGGIKHSKQNSLKFTVQLELSKSDEEEREMAFKSWKKRKDEISKHKDLEQYRKEQQRIESQLMNDEEKRSDAKAAFFAWKTHKSEISKIEKERKTWSMQKEKEIFEQKIQRDKEALEMYNLWLNNKLSAPKQNTFKAMKIKPPWTPPGKS